MRAGYAYAWPWLYPSSSSDLARDDNDKSLSGETLNELLWAWMEDREEDHGTMMWTWTGGSGYWELERVRLDGGWNWGISQMG